MLIAIACVDKDGRIYADGTVPFRIQKDIDRFSYLTSGGILIYEESVLCNFPGERTYARTGQYHHLQPSDC